MYTMQGYSTGGSSGAHSASLMRPKRGAGFYQTKVPPMFNPRTTMALISASRITLENFYSTPSTPATSMHPVTPFAHLDSIW